MALEPITREETYLAAAAGQSVETPEPITRKEMFLDAIAKSGGGGGGGGGAVYYADEIGALFHDSSFTTPVSFEEARDAVDIIIRMVWNSETIDFYPAFKHVIPGQETVRFHCLDYNDSGNPVFKQYFAGVTAG